MSIKNHKTINEFLDTSGQPSEAQFSEIRDLGVISVVNLAMPDSDGAIPKEGAIVSAAGMNYFHIPVKWEAPELDKYHLFKSILLAHHRQKLWIHCALNYRVSCFMYCYKVTELGIDAALAYKQLTDLWRPNTVWQGFIEKLV